MASSIGMTEGQAGQHIPKDILKLTNADVIINFGNIALLYESQTYIQAVWEAATICPRPLQVDF